jgi:hypothetical protein
MLGWTLDCQGLLLHGLILLGGVSAWFALTRFDQRLTKRGLISLTTRGLISLTTQGLISLTTRGLIRFDPLYASGLGEIDPLA